MNDKPSSINPQRLIKISKFLSYCLRHHPQKIGIQLAPGGWVKVDDLLAACQSHQFPLTRGELEEVVKNNDKQRFSFDEAGICLRANQGHSVTVDLQLKSLTPPPVLYHGTGQGAVESILRQGLQKMSRHHLHLSVDVETAKKVGQRQGKPVIFQVDTVAMCQAGYRFFCSENGVWLVEEIPSEYLSVWEGIFHAEAQRK